MFRYDQFVVVKIKMGIRFLEDKFNAKLPYKRYETTFLYLR